MEPHRFKILSPKLKRITHADDLCLLAHSRRGQHPYVLINWTTMKNAPAAIHNKRFGISGTAAVGVGVGS